MTHWYLPDDTKPVTLGGTTDDPDSYREKLISRRKENVDGRRRRRRMRRRMRRRKWRKRKRRRRRRREYGGAKELEGLRGEGGTETVTSIR